MGSIKSFLQDLMDEIFYYYWRGLASTLILQALLLLFLAALNYILDAHPTKPIDFFIGHGFRGFFLFGVNVAAVYTLTMVLFRGYISPLIFIVTTVLFVAGMKYLTGSFLIGFSITDSNFVLLYAIYAFLMAYFSALMHDELFSAIQYRTTTDEE